MLPSHHGCHCQHCSLPLSGKGLHHLGVLSLTPCSSSSTRWYACPKASYLGLTTTRPMPHSSPRHPWQSSQGWKQTSGSTLVASEQLPSFSHLIAIPQTQSSVPLTELPLEPAVSPGDHSPKMALWWHWAAPVWGQSAVMQETLRP